MLTREEIALDFLADWARESSGQIPRDTFLVELPSTYFTPQELLTEIRSRLQNGTVGKAGDLIDVFWATLFNHIKVTSAEVDEIGEHCMVVCGRVVPRAKPLTEL